MWREYRGLHHWLVIHFGKKINQIRSKKIQTRIDVHLNCPTKVEYCLLKSFLSKSFFSFSSLLSKFMFGRCRTLVVTAKCWVECAVQLRADRTWLFSVDLCSAIFRKCESPNMPLSNWTFHFSVAAAKEPFLCSAISSLRKILESQLVDEHGFVWLPQTQHLKHLV